MATSRQLVDYEAMRMAELETFRRAIVREIDRLQAIRRVLPDISIDEGCPRMLRTGLAGRTEDATFETYRGTCDGAHDDPATVYATPHAIVLGCVVLYVRDYLLGTLVQDHIVPEGEWERAMHEDGVPEPVVARCRSFLAKHTAREVRRRFAFGARAAEWPPTATLRTEPLVRACE